MLILLYQCATTRRIEVRYCCCCVFSSDFPGIFPDFFPFLILISFSEKNNAAERTIPDLPADKFPYVEKYFLFGFPGVFKKGKIRGGGDLFDSEPATRPF